MIDITRLIALHAETTQGDWQRCMANGGTCQCGLVWSSDLDAVVANCGSDPLVADEIPKITDEQMVANSAWVAASHNAWPAVAARLATLEEFAQRVSEAEYLYDEQATLHSLSAAVSWLEVATEKASFRNETHRTQTRHIAVEASADEEASQAASRHASESIRACKIPSR